MSRQGTLRTVQEQSQSNDQLWADYVRYLLGALFFNVPLLNSLESNNAEDADEDGDVELEDDRDADLDESEDSNIEADEEVTADGQDSADEGTKDLTKDFIRFYHLQMKNAAHPRLHRIGRMTVRVAPMPRLRTTPIAPKMSC